MEPNQETQPTAESTVEVAAETSAPEPKLLSFKTLTFGAAKEAWRFKSIFIAAYVYSAILLLIAGLYGLAVFLQFSSPDNSSFPIWMIVLGAVLAIIITVLSIFIGIGMQRALIVRATNPSFYSGYRWAYGSFLSIIILGASVQILNEGGFLLLIIPGIISSIYLSFAMPLLIDKGDKFTVALSNSFRLVSRRWWAVFWRIVVMFLFQTVIFLGVLAVTVMFSLLVSVVTPAQFALTSLVLIIPLTIAAVIVGLFLGAYMPTAGVMLYESARDTRPTYAERVLPKWLKPVAIILCIAGLLSIALDFTTEDFSETEDPSEQVIEEFIEEVSL